MDQPSQPIATHKTHQTQLKAELLRLQCLQHKSQTLPMWSLQEEALCEYFGTYTSLPRSHISASELLEQGGSRLIRTDGKIYLGQVQDKKMHGKGIALHRDGRVYEGTFQLNQKCGYGCEMLPNTNLYFGHFLANKKHGVGSFFWFSLCSDACTKNDDVQVEQYHGNWWGGLPDGQGEHYKANGNFYIGDFKNGLKSGVGVEHYSNGDVYKGQFVNGLAEGLGEYLWADGSNYKGSFKQGYRNGSGTWQSSNKQQKYTGNYLLDRKHGYGEYTWSNSNTVYKGHYIEDIRSGQGEMYCYGKLEYSGLWENGERAKMFKPIHNANNTNKVIISPNKKVFTSHLKSKSIGNNSMNFQVKEIKKTLFQTHDRSFGETRNQGQNQDTNISNGNAIIGNQSSGNIGNNSKDRILGFSNDLNLSGLAFNVDSLKNSFFINRRLLLHRCCKACIEKHSKQKCEKLYRRKSWFRPLNPQYSD